MEALAAITVPQILQFAYEALTFAWEQYENVQGNQAQCHLLIRRCQDLLVEVSKQINSLSGDEKANFGRRMMAQLRSLEAACLVVRTTIKRLANKGFAWRLLHQGKIKEELGAAELAVSDAFQAFNLGAHMSAQLLQVEIAFAQKKDQEDLVQRLDSVAVSDKKILAALQADSHGRKRIEELMIALDKHVRELGQISPKDQNDPAEVFIRNASSALQRISGTKPEIPHWAVTSLEVTFDPDDEEACIGKGGFGNIYKGEWNAQMVAVKEMYSEDARLLDRDNLKQIRQEIMIWSRVAHPHVLPFYCACLEATRPFMVTRFCGNGNALEYLRVHPEASRIRMLHEVSLGMLYLHSQGIIHADLKASNILIGDDGKALITDFGLSRLQDQVASVASRSKASGTLRWMAPELLDGEPLDRPADVYSFALLAWELYTGEVPFGDIPERAFTRRVVDKQERPKRPAAIEDDIWELIQQCWVHDPAARPLFGTIQMQLRSMITRAKVQTFSKISEYGNVSKKNPFESNEIIVPIPPDDQLLATKRQEYIKEEARRRMKQRLDALKVKEEGVMATALARIRRNVEQIQIPGATTYPSNPQGHRGKGICAVAEWDFKAEEDGEMNLVEGEFIEQIVMHDDGWWSGVGPGGKAGLFPASYVTRVGTSNAEPNFTSRLPSRPPTPVAHLGKTNEIVAIAEYDYTAQEDNEISFLEGDRINDIKKVDTDWWLGRLASGETGLFPANYVVVQE